MPNNRKKLHGKTQSFSIEIEGLPLANSGLMSQPCDSVIFWNTQLLHREQKMAEAPLPSAINKP
jgi:hypothetical protein